MLRQIAFLCVPLPVLAADNSALIAAATGTVTVRKTALTSAKVSAFDWLPEGAVLRTGADSKAIVILLNGHRFELGPGAHASIGAEKLSLTEGPIKELDPIPPVPKAPPLAAKMSTHAAVAFRVKDRPVKFTGFCPANGSAALAGPVVFSFPKVEGAVAYRIEVKDNDGNLIAQEQTKSTEITVPLEPGAGYKWRVRVFGETGQILDREVGFATLSNEQKQERQAFADRIRDLPDGLALLAEADYSAGLFREAIDEFHAALKLKPDDPGLQHGLSVVEAELDRK